MVVPLHLEGLSLAFINNQWRVDNIKRGYADVDSISTHTNATIAISASKMSTISRSVRHICVVQQVYIV